MSVYLHRIAITSTEWVANGSLRVVFASNHSKIHQVYAGRQLVGVTRTTTERECVCDVDQYARPQWMTVVAVDDELADYGGDLPNRAYNVPVIQIPAQTGVDRIVASIGSQTEEVVGLTVAREVVMPPQPTGDLTVTITPYDDRPAGGNAGTPVEVDLRSESMPPDIYYESERFTATTDASGIRIQTTMPSVL